MEFYCIRIVVFIVDLYVIETIMQDVLLYFVVAECQLGRLIDEESHTPICAKNCK